MKRLLLLIAVLSVAFAAMPTERSFAAHIEEERSGSKSFDLMADGVGISFGNSKRVRGLRFNVRDEGVEEVFGLNFTLWKPGENSDAVMKGLLLGIYGPSADELNFISIGLASVEAHSLISGIAIGGGAVVCEGALNGISVAGLANVAGSMNGITLGGLANVTEGSVNGITLGGLANVAEGRVSGITIGGLANVAEEGISGISIGGLANVTEGIMKGISVGGLATVSEVYMTGISVAGLAVVSESGMTGVSIGGLAVVTDRGPLSGINFGGIFVGSKGPTSGLTLSLGGIYADELAGLNVGVIGMLEFPSISIENTIGGDSYGFSDAYKNISYTGISAKSARWITVHGIDIEIEEDLTGFAASGIRIDAGRIRGLASSLIVISGEMHGLGIGAVNYSSDLQVGLSIGIVNYTEHLNGVQLGLVNIARNKSKPFQILPILNVHFD